VRFHHLPLKAAAPSTIKVPLHSHSFNTTAASISALLTLFKNAEAGVKGYSLELSCPASDVICDIEQKVDERAGLG